VVDALSVQPHTQGALYLVVGLAVAWKIVAGCEVVGHLRQALLPPFVIGVPLRRVLPPVLNGVKGLCVGEG
jgi:hypothetical protein